MLGSSSLTEGNDGGKVASPLISRSEPQGSSTLTDERCLCNTRLSCIMTDVYFSDKLSNTSSHPSIHLLTCSIATRKSPEEQHTCLASTASCWLNVLLCCPVKALNNLKCQMASRKLQAAITSHHLQHMQIFSQRHRKSINTSSTTESRHPVGRNNNNLPKTLSVHPNPPASISRHIAAIHCQVIFKKSWSGARSWLQLFLVHLKDGKTVAPKNWQSPLQPLLCN